MSTDAIRANFDRLAVFESDRWNNNTHYHPYLLSHLPASCGSSLDIGCGAGGFARDRACRSRQVLGLDLMSADSRWELIPAAAALPANLLLRLLKTGRLRSSAAERAAWDEHGGRDVYPRLSTVRQICRTLLPGAVVRKHFFWRYSIVWRKP